MWDVCDQYVNPCVGHSYSSHVLGVIECVHIIITLKIAVTNVTCDEFGLTPALSFHTE